LADKCWSRRKILQAVLGGMSLSSALFAHAQQPGRRPRERSLADLERDAGGRLGVSVLDTASGTSLAHRGDERFGLCSTFKLLLAAVILREADRGRLKLDALVDLAQSPMVPHSPVTRASMERGRMSVAALAQATQVESDNLAANLLLGLIGGPAGFTALLRETGDNTTRLDRLEPDLNFVPPGDLRDTTTPEAMAHSVARLLTTNLLAPAARDTLVDWMVMTQTGARRLRAGLPSDWRAGDKTGTGAADGMPDKINDVAIVFPPGRAPLVVAAYYESPVRSNAIRDQDQAVLGEVGRITADWVNRRA